MVISQTGSGTNLTLTKDGVSITVYVIKSDINLTKSIISIPYPKTTGRQSSTPGDSDYAEVRNRLIDILNKAEYRVTVTGFLDSDDQTTTADYKRNQLIRWFFAGQASASSMVKITSWDGAPANNTTCAIDKLQISRVINDNIEGPGIVTYEVTFSMLIGTFDGSVIQL